MFTAEHYQNSNNKYSCHIQAFIHHEAKWDTVFKATQINKQPVSVTVFVGNNKTFEQNNYMINENIAIHTDNTQSKIL